MELLIFDLGLDVDQVAPAAQLFLFNGFLLRHESLDPPKHFKQGLPSVVVSLENEVLDLVPLGLAPVLARYDLNQPLLDHLLLLLGQLAGRVVEVAQQLLNLLLLLIVFEIHVLAEHELRVVRQEEKVKLLLDLVQRHGVEGFKQLVRVCVLELFTRICRHLESPPPVVAEDVDEALGIYCLLRYQLVLAPDHVLRHLRPGLVFLGAATIIKCGGFHNIHKIQAGHASHSALPHLKYLSGVEFEIFCLGREFRVLSGHRLDLKVVRGGFVIALLIGWRLRADAIFPRNCSLNSLKTNRSYKDVSRLKLFHGALGVHSQVFETQLPLILSAFENIFNPEIMVAKFEGLAMLAVCSVQNLLVHIIVY